MYLFLILIAFYPPLDKCLSSLSLHVLLFRVTYRNCAVKFLFPLSLFQPFVPESTQVTMEKIITQVVVPLFAPSINQLYSYELALSRITNDLNVSIPT